MTDPQVRSVSEAKTAQVGWISFGEQKRGSLG